MEAQPHPTRGDLRIFIASTPKAGNIWLKHLLAHAYSLPVRELDDSVDDESLAALGRRWVAHQHFSPNSRVIRCLRKHGVIVLTMLRHPCDVLISLSRYLAEVADAEARDPHAAAMLADDGVFAEATIAYLRGEFAAQINLSLCWWRVGATPVRYEDLAADPIGTLRGLTALIGPVSENRLRASVALCGLGRMRQRHRAASHHFRKGRAGGWREVLPPAVVEVFRSEAPYPAQFAALGYTLDRRAREEPPAATDAFVDAFKGAVTFDNGVGLTDLMVELYYANYEETHVRWPDPTRTAGPESYFAWLNSPCEDDPRRGEPGILFTTLAYAIYRQREDLQCSYPDIFGENRIDYANWFFVFARSEFQLDLAFLSPVFESIARATTIVAPDAGVGGVDQSVG